MNINEWYVKHLMKQVEEFKPFSVNMYCKKCRYSGFGISQIDRIYSIQKRKRRWRKSIVVTVNVPYICEHLENRIETIIDTWLKWEVIVAYLMGPEVRNLHNNCSLYEEKVKSKGIRCPLQSSRG